MIDPDEALKQLLKMVDEAEQWSKSERLAPLPGMSMLVEAVKKYVAENDVHDGLYARQKLVAVEQQLQSVFEGDEDDKKVVKRQLFDLWCAIGNVQVGIFGKGEVPRG